MAAETRITFDETLRHHPEYGIYDGLLATGLCICFLIALPGNRLALKYFIHTKKRNLSTLLYILACCIDIVTSLIPLPVIANLFNKRDPGILGNKAICITWYRALMILQQMSMFTVMLQSVCRAIVITYPFYKVNKKTVLLAFAINFVFHGVFLTLLMRFSQASIRSYSGYCQTHLLGDVLGLIYMVISSITTGLPPVIVFVAFIITIDKLHGKNGTEAEISQKNNAQACITIIVFAAIFLLCNLPTFIHNALYTITLVNFEYPDPIYRPDFMFWYSSILSEIFVLVLNASLNPLLYLCRMKEMRLWVHSLFRKV